MFSSQTPYSCLEDFFTSSASLLINLIREETGVIPRLHFHAVLTTAYPATSSSLEHMALGMVEDMDVGSMALGSMVGMAEHMVLDSNVA